MSSVRLMTSIPTVINPNAILQNMTWNAFHSKFSLVWCLLTTLKINSNNYRKKLSKISPSISCLVEVNIYPSNVPTNRNCLNDVVIVFSSEWKPGYRLNITKIISETSKNHLQKLWKDLCPLIEMKSWWLSKV